jgi:hypothetical protein
MSINTPAGSPPASWAGSPGLYHKSPFLISLIVSLKLLYSNLIRVLCVVPQHFKETNFDVDEL